MSQAKCYKSKKITMQFNDIIEFLNSSFGLFLLGSIALPAILALNAKYKEKLTKRKERELEIRECVYRYLVIEDAYKEGSFDHLNMQVSPALNGNKGILPQFKDISLEGMLLLVTPHEELKNGALPQAVYNVKKFRDILTTVENAAGLTAEREKIYHEKKCKDEVEKVLLKMRNDREKLAKYLS